MKITRVETIRLDEFTNLLWVRVHTDAGMIGLGETFFGARAAEAYIHETAAPSLIGRDPLQIERIARDLTPYIGFAGTGAELNRKNRRGPIITDHVDESLRAAQDEGVLWHNDRLVVHVEWKRDQGQ